MQLYFKRDTGSFLPEKFKSFLGFGNKETSVQTEQPVNEQPVDKQPVEKRLSALEIAEAELSKASKEKIMVEGTYFSFTTAIKYLTKLKNINVFNNLTPKQLGLKSAEVRTLCQDIKDTIGLKINSQIIQELITELSAIDKIDNQYTLDQIQKMRIELNEELNKLIELIPILEMEKEVYVAGTLKMAKEKMFKAEQNYIKQKAIEEEQTDIQEAA